MAKVFKTTAYHSEAEAERTRYGEGERQSDIPLVHRIFVNELGKLASRGEKGLLPFVELLPDGKVMSPSEEEKNLLPIAMLRLVEGMSVAFGYMSRIKDAPGVEQKTYVIIVEDEELLEEFASRVVGVSLVDEKETVPPGTVLN